MKTILSTIIFCSFSAMSFAQIVIAPEEVGVENVAPSDFEGIAYSLITNDSDFDKNFVWERNVIDISEGWTSAVCDVVQCHFDFISTAQFFLSAGETGNIDVHVYPNDIEGGAIIEVTVRNATNANEFATGTYYFNQALSAPERISDKLNVFPNPAADFINIEGGQDVSRIEFFDLSGKLVKEIQSLGVQNLSISDLPEGSYILRMWNAENTALSTNVLIKN